MKSVDEIYRSIPADVASEIRLHVQMSGTLQHILKRLQIPAAHGLVHQHNALFEFIDVYGPEVFMEAIQKQLTSQEFARLKAQRLNGVMSKLYETSPKSEPFRKPAPAEFQAEARTSDPSASQTSLRIEAAITSEGGLAANEYSTGKAVARTARLISTPTYHGPDRRAGNERRHGRGRREVITPLFGGERRQDERRFRERRSAVLTSASQARGVTGERRKSDRRKTHVSIPFADRRRNGVDRRRNGRS
jgi:hypothetical protein